MEDAIQAGAAYLFYGPVSGEYGVADAEASFRGQDVCDYAGKALLGGMDVDGDGLPDLLFGTPSNQEDGAAHLILSGGM